jgi:hypothetical protein
LENSWVSSWIRTQCCLLGFWKKFLFCIISSKPERHKLNNKKEILHRNGVMLDCGLRCDVVFTIYG